MIKKLIIMLSILTIGLVGCNSGVTENTIITDNTELEDFSAFTFSMLLNQRLDNPYSEDWRILQEYKNIRNVSFDMVLGDDASFENAIDLNLNLDSPPDVILKCWPDTIDSYASEGKLLAISDYEDLMPNYQAYIEDNNLQEEIDKLKLSNGKYYILPGYQRDMQVQQWIYRKDVFEKNSISTPTTYDELYTALVTLKDIYPDSTPITASWEGAHLFSMMGAGYGIPAGWSGTRYFNQENDQWEFSPRTDSYRELYRFLNKSYTAGILDDDIFTQTNDQFIGKITDGRAFVTVTWISSGFDNWNNELVANGITDGEWVPLPVMESTIGTIGLPAVNRLRKGISISTNALNKPYFEDMIKFLDWAIYSEEGIDLTYWGVEGLTYETTSDGKQFLPDIISSNNPNGTINMKHNGFSSIFDLCENEAYEDNKKPDEIVTFLERSEQGNETLEPDPNLILSIESIEMINLLSTDLNEYVNEASLDFITGELDIDDDWSAYVAELENLGYETIESIWNNAWSEQNE